MRRGVILAWLGCWLSTPSALPAQQAASELQQALTLQRVMQKVIAQVEPSIACVLVSRSNAYRPPTPDAPGRLGTFDPSTLMQRDIKSDAMQQLRKKLDMADSSYVPQSFGSGVVVDKTGLILTNYHVVQDATKIYVRLPGRKEGYADIHAADPRSDLAVLRLLNARALPLTPLALGDAERLERGQFVLSIANPFAAGFRDGQPSASWGILSNIRRRAVAATREEATRPLHRHGTLLQTDARLHLGCSGGALVNLQGELIGLSTALAAIQGGETPGGFALPVNAGLRRILEVLKRGEEVEYGFLGVSTREHALEGEIGLPLDFVLPGSPAALQGQLDSKTDSIVAIDGQPIHDSDDLFVQLGTHLAGSKVRLQVHSTRTNKDRQVEVTLAKLYVPGKKIASSLGRRPFLRGLRVDYSSLLAQPARTAATIPAGVLITDVQPGSVAEQARLRSGEVITQVNGRPVPTPAAFYQAALGVTGPLELTLLNPAPQEPASKVVLR
jgi:S1-C subfamily serine protease